jgi:hypothetical protein
MRRTLDDLAIPEGGDQERPKMRQLRSLTTGLLLAASTFGVGPAAATEGFILPSVAQIPEPDTNPPSREECRKLAAEAQVRTLDDEKDRLSLCLALQRDAPDPAAPDSPEADPLDEERQG